MVFDISPHLEAHLLYQEHFSFLLDTNVSVLLQPRLFDKLVSCTGSGIYYHYVSFYSIWGCECVALIKKKKNTLTKIFHRVKNFTCGVYSSLDLQNLLELINIYFNNSTASPNVLDWAQVSYFKVYLYYP